MREILECTIEKKLTHLLNILSQQHFIHTSCMDWPGRASVKTGQFMSMEVGK
jgi:hypothetical protein